VCSAATVNDLRMPQADRFVEVDLQRHVIPINSHKGHLDRFVNWSSPIWMVLKELAHLIGFLSEQIDRLEDELLTLTADAAPALLGVYGVGPHVAAQLIAAVIDNADRLTSEASMVKLCAACPIP
jgi:hypothetical protein